MLKHTQNGLFLHAEDPTWKLSVKANAVCSCKNCFVQSLKNRPLLRVRDRVKVAPSQKAEKTLYYP